MDTFETIRTVLAVRKYQDKPVEQEKLEFLLQAAMAAPSAAFHTLAFLSVPPETSL